ncbi:MAG: hypothetical protein HY319_14430 [Armatimonadetes bacterium]|nr:hypothetical protein [Armatimonadota bacterium]
MSDAEVQQELARLHEASRAMDLLASRAQEERTPELGVALVTAVGDWIELIERFVDRCQDQPLLDRYFAAVQALEHLLTGLETAHSAEELGTVRTRMPLVVEQWSSVMGELLESAVADAEQRLS